MENNRGREGGDDLCSIILSAEVVENYKIQQINIFVIL
jgi:hypothetical protein